LTECPIEDILSDEIEYKEFLMHDPETYEVRVLVVGGGPAGLTAAGALGRLGVDCLVVERRPSLSALPRATSVSTRSMEILRSFGLEDEVRAGGADVEWLMLSCETLAEVAAATPVPIGLPTREQSRVISPTSPACVPQDHLEPVLLDHARSNGVRVELGVEATAVQPADDGVLATVRDAATGRVREVHARYLIAADGAHGRVRSELGIPAHGLDALGEAVSAVFDAPIWPILGQHRYGIYDINHPEATGVLLPAGRGDRWLYGVVWGPGEDAAPTADAEWFTRRIRLLAGVPDLPVAIERTGRFRFATQLAERYREERAFLVGDAAHRVTPRGGTGMNTAIHDGYDLGWKLGWVLRGWASEGLLDSYEIERRPVAEHNMARSADRAGSAQNADLALQADLGGRIPHVHVQTEAGPMSTLDLLGPGLTVFAGPDGGRWEAPDGVAADRVPVTVHTVDPIAARALGLRRGEALVVRPDGTPAAATGRERSQAAAA
jgi:2-polyprenyl-6-methoxyphenol hydroxylase-like FAD-dependent oxidoreductase